MTFRRFNDYSQLAIWLFTMSFLCGGFYYEVSGIKKTLEERKAYIEAARSFGNQLTRLEVEAQNRDKFQDILEQMLKEMQITNKEIISEMSDIKEISIQTKYKLEAMEKKISPN